MKKTTSLNKLPKSLALGLVVLVALAGVILPLLGGAPAPASAAGYSAPPPSSAVWYEVNSLTFRESGDPACTDVNTTGGTGTGAAGCTLRQALTQTNAAPGTDTIYITALPSLATAANPPVIRVPSTTANWMCPSGCTTAPLDYNRSYFAITRNEVNLDLGGYIGIINDTSSNSESAALWIDASNVTAAGFNGIFATGTSISLADGANNVTFERGSTDQSDTNPYQTWARNNYWSKRGVTIIGNHTNITFRDWQFGHMYTLATGAADITLYNNSGTTKTIDGLTIDNVIFSRTRGGSCSGTAASGCYTPGLTQYNGTIVLNGLSLTNSKFLNFRDGAQPIKFDLTTLTINDSLIENNLFDGFSGISSSYLELDNAKMNDVTFADNTFSTPYSADKPEHIIDAQASTLNNTKFIGNTFTGIETGLAPIRIMNSNATNLTFNDNELDSITSPYAIVTIDPSTVNGATFNGNTFTNTKATGESTIYFEGSTMGNIAIRDNLFRNNTVATGASYGVVSLQGNKAPTGPITITGNTFINDPALAAVAINQPGGSTSAATPSQLTIEGNHFDGFKRNTIQLTGLPTATVRNNTFGPTTQHQTASNGQLEETIGSTSTLSQMVMYYFAAAANTNRIIPWIPGTPVVSAAACTATIPLTPGPTATGHTQPTLPVDIDVLWTTPTNQTVDGRVTTVNGVSGTSGSVTLNLNQVRGKLIRLQTFDKGLNGATRSSQYSRWVQVPDQACVPPAIQITKEAFADPNHTQAIPSGSNVSPGQTVYFVYHYTNTGSTPIFGVAVTDDQKTDGPVCSSPYKTRLEPGASGTCYWLQTMPTLG